MKRIKGSFSALTVLCLIMTLLSGTTVQAEGVGTIDIQQEIASLGLGQTTVVDVNYSDMAGGYAELGLVSANSSVAVAALSDTGNQTAKLTITSTGVGATTIAVYRTSNAAVVDYIAVQSGLATSDSQIVTQVNGSMLTTIYKDRVVNYPYVMTGAEQDQLAVNGLIIEPKSGRDCLKVTGQLLTKETKIPGINTFYANFYGAGGELMRRQPVFSRDPYTGNLLEIEWYIPEGCAAITLE